MLNERSMAPATDPAAKKGADGLNVNMADRSIDLISGTTVASATLAWGAATASCCELNWCDWEV